MINALTFDVEEYFHAEAFAGVVDPRDWATLESRVVGTTERILMLLEEARVAATFFVLGWVADRYPSLVRAIGRGGHEVASHGYGHQMITRLSRAEFAEDIRRGKGAVEDAAGTAVIGYRAPTFSVVRETLWSLDILAEAGFRYDSSIFPIVHDRYGIPDAPRFPHQRPVGDGSAIGELDRRRGPVAGAGGRRGVLPPSPVRADAAGAALPERDRAAARHRVPAFVGARHRPTPLAGGPVDPVPALREHPRSGIEAAAAREGLPLWTRA